MKIRSIADSKVKHFAQDFLETIFPYLPDTNWFKGDVKVKIETDYFPPEPFPCIVELEYDSALYLTASFYTEEGIVGTAAAKYQPRGKLESLALMYRNEDESTTIMKELPRKGLPDDSEPDGIVYKIARFIGHLIEIDDAQKSQTYELAVKRWNNDAYIARLFKRYAELAPGVDPFNPSTNDRLQLAYKLEDLAAANLDQANAMTYDAFELCFGGLVPAGTGMGSSFASRVDRSDREWFYRDLLRNKEKYGFKSCLKFSNNSFDR